MDLSVPAGAAKLLDLIASVEAPHGYNTVYANKQASMPKPLISMTIDQVIADGKRRAHAYGSSAAGRYQLMEATLKSLKSELHLTGHELFNQGMQDRLGYHLLKRRGYHDFVAGRISVATFGLHLAQEWASFPVLTACKGAHRQIKSGQSYYAGDGLNKCLISPSKVTSCLAACLAHDGPKKDIPSGIKPDRSPGAAPAPPKPATITSDQPIKKGVLKRFGAWIDRVFT